MPGPAPKPNAVRRASHAPTFEWVVLPAEGRQGPPPPVPGWHPFSDDAKAEWAAWWAMPWATQWRENDPALGRLLYIFDMMIDGRGTAALLAEARQIEDRFGFSPRARMQLRWIVKDEDGSDGRARQPVSPSTKARRRSLKVI